MSSVKRQARVTPGEQRRPVSEGAWETNTAFLLSIHYHQFRTRVFHGGQKNVYPIKI